MRKNKFTDDPDYHEISRICVAAAVILAVTGTMAFWFFTTWAKVLGL